MKKVLFAILFLSSLFTGQLSFAKEKDGGDEKPEMIDNSVVIDRIANGDIEVSLPPVIFTFSEVDVKLKFVNPNHTRLLVNKGKVSFIVNGEDKLLTFENGEASFKHKFDKDRTLKIFAEDFSYTNTVTAYPLWAILVPIGFILFWMIKRMIKK
ncbi:MAG: hypothetical protein ACJ77K_07500 [Bacteroidia bacterium]